MGVDGQRHAPDALPSGKGPGTNCTGDWVGPGAFWHGTENLTPTGIRFPYPSARSEWLYRVGCPGPLTALCLGKTRSILQCVIIYIM
jgi:hypothetical protein